jgi:predicted GTPase
VSDQSSLMEMESDRMFVYLFYKYTNGITLVIEKLDNKSNDKVMVKVPSLSINTPFQSM